MTLALRSYPNWSYLTLTLVAQWLSGVTGSIAMIGVISRTGPVLALIVAAFLVVSMLFSMRITKVSTAQSPLIAKMEQRITYVTRV